MSDALLWIITLVVTTLLSDELLSWTPRLARFLVFQSTRKLPSDVRERMYEEYLSDIDDREGKLSKLVAAVDSFRGVYLINHDRLLPGISFWVPILLRTLDLVIGVAGLIAALPMFALASLLLWINHRFSGHILNRHTYVGLNGDEFTLYTFNIQKYDASRKCWRVSFIGKLLLSSGLRTLPSLLNVLRGDMSLVGPPPRNSYLEYNLILSDVRYFERRKIRPGMTGLSQCILIREPHLIERPPIAPPVGATQQDQLEAALKIEQQLAEVDLSYVRNYGVKSYFKVLYLTVCLVLAI